MNFQKECISGDGLRKTKWSFMLFDSNDKLTFVLNSYYKFSKASKRNSKWNIDIRYERISGRDNTIAETEVPMPDFIHQEINEFVQSRVQIKKWSEYKLF